MNRTRKMLGRLSILVFLSFISFVGAGTRAVASSDFINRAQIKLEYDKKDGTDGDADGRYYHSFITHDGMKVVADGKRSECEMSADDYKKTRIERGEIYSGSHDGLVYYLRMSSTGSLGTLQSPVSAEYELIERDVYSGTETVVHKKTAEATEATKDFGYFSCRQGNTIYILEKLKKEVSADNSYYMLYFDIAAFDLTERKESTYGSYALRIDSSIGNMNIMTFICGFFVSGDGRVGLFCYEVKYERKSETVSYGAEGESFSSIRLYDKNSGLISDHKLASQTFSSDVYQSRYDPNTGNLYFTGVGMGGSECLMVANLSGDTLRMAPSYIDYAKVERERSIIGGYEGSVFGSMDLLGGRYLAAMNSEWDFSEGAGDSTVQILDAANISYDKVDLVNEGAKTEGSKGPEPEIYRLNHPGRAQSLRLSNRFDVTLFAMKVRGREDDFTRKVDLLDSAGSFIAYDVSGVGVKSDYYAARDSIVFNTGEKEITEVSVKDKKVIAKYQTRHPVWCTMVSGNTLVVMEREGSKGNTWVGNPDRNARRISQNIPEQFYFESIDLTFPQTTGIELSGKNIRVGDSVDIKAVYNTAAKPAVKLSSSDESVFSVTADGHGAAWKAGSATITATREDGGMAGVVTIEVKQRSIPVSTKEIKTDHFYSSVYALQNYEYGHVISEWIEELDDGRLMRVGQKTVTKTKDEGEDGITYSKVGDSICATYYSGSGGFIDEKTIPLELSIFGGFYAGKDNYFLVFGDTNYGETTGVNEKEVIRVVKYDKDWNRLGACSFYGKETDTVAPFEAATVRMDETDDGVLYIHTAKLLYKDKAGLNHQMNMLLALDTKTMTGISTPEVDSNDGRVAVDGYYARNVAFCSHSFDQFVKTEGDMVYLLALGDDNPRGCVDYRVDRNGVSAHPGSLITMKNTSDRCLLLRSIYYPEGYTGGSGGQNETGMNIGGFEISATGTIGVGNYYRKMRPEKWAENERRNIFITMRDKTYPQNYHRYLTDYDSKTSKIFTWRPKLVKLDDNHFLMMWMEYKNDPKKKFFEQDFYTCMQHIDANGNPIGKRVKKNIYLSDCDPIVRKDGSVSWFADGVDKVILYTIDPYDLTSVKESEKMVIYDEDYDIGKADTDTEDKDDDIYKGAQKPKCNLKNKRIYSLNKTMTISSGFAIKSITLNGKRVFKKKKNTGLFDTGYRLSELKKKLKLLKKKKGKYKKTKKKLNKLVIKNVAGKSCVVRFYVRA